MKVVSLFDGMACGLESLKRAGIHVTEYHAFENDKYAIQIAKKNHPEIIHHGEINFMTDFSCFKGADLLIGGSPCQGFSMAGRGLNFKDKRSQLFFEYLRAKKEIKPKWFLLENVRMKKEIQHEISRLMGCQPVLINSALVSAQNRQRLYWCNWKVKQPADREIYLKDIIENGVVDRDKSYCIDANYAKGGNVRSYFEHGKRQLVFRQKSKTVRSSGRGSYDRHEWDSVDINHIRKLSTIECERLQTLNDNYTEGVSNTQRYKMLGNGWNVETIVHILQENKNL